MPIILTRRSLMARAASGIALTSIGGGVRVSLAASPTPATDILVVCCMRGGQDALQMVAPAGDANYMRARPTIRVAPDGAMAGIGVGTLSGIDMYLHPNLPEIKTLYDSGKLAIVQAVGIPTIDRSHFVCQDLMERGMGDSDAFQSLGWLARHTPSLGPSRTALSTVASGSNNPASLSGDLTAAAISDIAYFNIAGGEEVASRSLRRINSGDNRYETAVRNLLNTVDIVQDGRRSLQSGGAEVDYGFSAFGESLKSLATMIKMDIGVDTATVDMSSWDHHSGLENVFEFIATDYSRALAVFWKDIEKFQHRVTLVTMTEFGRRFTENSSRGLDHGAGSMMMVLGGNVKGGKIYGDWPGLAPNELDDDSLRATIDYRRVLSEIIVKRHGERDPGNVFPTVKYNPIGIVSGNDSAVKA